jgi:hypothetical protein
MSTFLPAALRRRAGRARSYSGITRHIYIGVFSRSITGGRQIFRAARSVFGIGI